MTVVVDPNLLAAIQSGKKRNRKVHAAFTLRRKRGGKVLSPEDTDKIVERIVKKAAEATQKSADKVVVFKNLQSFSIDAPADLVERLASEDAIGTAALGS